MSTNCYNLTYSKVGTLVATHGKSNVKRNVMRVNSAFPGFFCKRLLKGPGIVIVTLGVFIIALSFSGDTDPDLPAKQVNLSIRQIGHRLLLQGADSTSRVLPVTEIKDGTFLLKFENEFVFNHDSLMALSKRLLPKTQFPSGYTVTVHDCVTGGIVYGFQLNNNSPDILACSGRVQPRGCYTIEFAFPDFNENVKQQKAEIAQLTEPVKVEPREDNRKPGESKTATFNIDQKTEGLKSVKVVPREVNSKLQELKTTTFGYPLSYLVYGGMLVLLGVTLLIVRYRKMLKPVTVPGQDYVIIQEAVPEFPPLGKFSFDVNGQSLMLGDELINLTDKECKVLELLHKNFGELIPRDTLMEEVWIKEGVITSRSLDMFVSKLRKKLGGDPELRITNVHGKGYKLETLTEKQFI
jgi:hypothetical protein